MIRTRKPHIDGDDIRAGDGKFFNNSCFPNLHVNPVFYKFVHSAGTSVITLLKPLR